MWLAVRADAPLCCMQRGLIPTESQTLTPTLWCAQTADPNYLDAVGNDVQIFNYFLNLEYLLAEFYSCAATGQGIPAAARGGGPASTGCQQATLTGPVAVRVPLGA